MSFDILHSGVWTSPYMSSLSHKYYVLFSAIAQFVYRHFQFQTNLKPIQQFKN